MAKIKVMSANLANMIAAGEVVEKVASVVKELVENSIDANSSEIKIDLIESGVREIKVTDNGAGMIKEDAVLAFERHATSKLTQEADLFHINTLGFRGEALPSIASISDVTLKTSTGEVGTIVHINGGNLLECSSGDARTGTTITVKDLFFNTPARLKHMKSLYSELANVSDYVNKMALSHPEVKFVLTNDGSTLLNTDGKGNLLKTIKDVFGLEVVRKIVEVKAENDDYQISGYISLPEVSRSTRSSMVTLVNGRVIRNIELNRYINDAYHGYKPDNRYPIVVLNITGDTNLIDVNVHPTKMDVKFSKMEELGMTISSMIKNALKPKNLIVNVDVQHPLNEELGAPSPYENLTFDFSEQLVKEPAVELSFDNENPKMTENATLEVKFPKLYPVGLVHGTYIICQNELGMYMIDQHAAKERVNYEFYKQKLGSPSDSATALLVPFTFEFPSNEFIILNENFAFLKEHHFNIAPFGINSVIITEHPTWLPRGYEEEATRKILEIVIDYEKNFSVEKFNEATAIMMSCKLSIKANENITLGEMENLIADLAKCDNPFNCPHGRPTIIHYSSFDLEKLFKRSGFNWQKILLMYNNLWWF